MRYHALAWLLLAASIAAEVVGTIALRYADGFTRLRPSLAVGSLYALAIWLMSLSMRHLEVGLARGWHRSDGGGGHAVVRRVFPFGTADRLAFVVAGVICLNLDWR